MKTRVKNFVLNALIVFAFMITPVMVIKMYVRMFEDRLAIPLEEGTGFITGMKIYAERIGVPFVAGFGFCLLIILAIKAIRFGAKLLDR